MSAPFDVAVVGLGHAGAEAALAAARMGCRVVGFSPSIAKAGLMSCNPAIGGPGKSQLVAEIDALGGAMAEAADESGIQFRRLNRSKGPALRATRAQTDRSRYARAIQRRLRVQERLVLVEGSVAALLADAGAVSGVRLADGREILARTVVVTAGTFLAARMHVGARVEAGGRAGDNSEEALSTSLRYFGLRLRRFKTGTPPRLDGRTIDWTRCIEQPSEADAGPLSRRTAPGVHPALPQRSCWTTHTTGATHRVVASHLHESPLFAGAITGRGPRYCPSLEHKVVGHPDHDRHPVYLEPDGLDTAVVYPAGISTSLPEEVQRELLRTIPGLESVEIVRPGYAVEYDCVPAQQLEGSLRVRGVGGLYLAGQINGSSGYEEAAGQGLVAGCNAALEALGRAPWIPDRDESYLGLLCDDLTARGFDEPYRVLPARAEARLTLREDNAWLRLWRVGRELGLAVEGESARAAEAEREIRQREAGLDAATRSWIRRPETTLEETAALPLFSGASGDVVEQVYLALRYGPYETQRQAARARLQERAGWPIPEDMRFQAIVGLSGEAIAALAAARPATLGEAGALSGVGPSALAVLAAHLRRRRAAA